MLFILMIYVGLCLHGIRFHNKFNKEYLSKEQTASIKGIFILLVFLSHFNSYVTFNGTLNWYYIHAVGFFGQTMVTLFLFYSGYGVMESIQKKGMNYVDAIPKKRVLGTLFRFDCAIILFLCVGFITNNVYDVRRILLSLIGWDHVGNSNWYIFVILLLYMITYLSFKIFKGENYLLPITCVFILTMCWACYCYITNIRTLMWYDTALCYVFGMLWSIYKEKIEVFINKSNIVWGLTLFVAILGFFGLRKTSSIVSALLVNLVFVVIVVVFTMRVNVGNKILQRAGELLFEIYILQRIPMILFKYIGLHEVNVYIYFVSCLLTTILLVKPFKFCCDKLWKMLAMRG